MPKLSDVLGEYVKQEGKETRYYCLVCGCKSLLINGTSHVWFCHVCQQGGRYTPREDMRDSEITAEYLEPSREGLHTWDSVDAMLDTMSWAFWEKPTTGFDQRNIGETVLTSLDARVKKDGNNSYLLLPFLTIGGSVCGSQMYRYVPKFGGDYVTHGTRSLCQYGKGHNLILFEGMFDFLSVAQTLESAGEVDHYTLMFLGGNSPSPQQMDWLVVCAGSYGSIRIGFDNDKVFPSIRLVHQLRLYCNTQVSLWTPPEKVTQKSCKDWDDVVQADSYYVLDSLGR